MAIQKTAADGGNPAQVKFYYDIEKLYDSVSMRTNRRANIIIDDKTGITQEDIYAINESEKVAMKDFMTIGVRILSAKVLRILPGVASPVFIEETFTPVGLTGITASGFIILDKTTYVNDVLNEIDVLNETFLRHNILEQWYIFCAMKDEIVNNHVLSIEAFKGISKKMLQLKMPSAT